MWIKHWLMWSKHGCHRYGCEVRCLWLRMCPGAFVTPSFSFYVIMLERSIAQGQLMMMERLLIHANGPEVALLGKSANSEVNTLWQDPFPCWNRFCHPCQVSGEQQQGVKSTWGDAKREPFAQLNMKTKLPIHVTSLSIFTCAHG